MFTKRKLSLSTPQPAKKERKAIDLDTKMKVIKQYEGGKKVNVIARDTKLSHSTVSTILKDKERIREAVKGSAPMRSTIITKHRSGPIHEMEKLLYIWMEDQIQKRTPLSLFTVQMKARSLFQTLKERAGEDYSQGFVASTGWFQRFKKRFQMHSVRVTREAASADEEGAQTVKNRSKKSSKKTNTSSSSSSGGSGSSSSSSNSSISKLPPVCYEIITLKTKKKKKMAADIFPRKKPANSSSTTVQQYHQQNLSNNNLIPAPNWQGLYPTIRERNAVMFNNDLMADVHFVVGPPGGTQRLPGHKYVLAVGSSVFHAMFYGELAEDKDEIRIPDVEPAAFLAMLKYIYCDEIDLAADTVLATLYAAKKYIVPHLARACVNFLETSLSAKNACVLLSQSCLFEEPDLTQRCWEVIDAQAELALKSEGFCDIDFQTLESILRRETLNAKEIVVFEAALNWAEVECQRQDLALSIENKRKVLGKALYLIRIPTMALDDFANGAAQSGVLTLNETNDIFLWYTAAKKPELQFVSKARKGLVPQRCHRFQSCAYRSNQWRYRGRCDSIQFAVDKRVFIAGFGLYGSSCGSAEYSAKIELKRQGVVLGQNLSKYFSDGSSNTFPVWFEYPVQIEPDTFYTASVILDGNELSYFGQEGMTEVQCGKVTVQFQCSSDSTNGTGVQGGQIPELIFYA